jgi:hypothetical protein
MTKNLIPPFFIKPLKVLKVVITTLTTERLTPRPNNATHPKTCGIAGRPSFTLSMTPNDAYEASSREYARPSVRLIWFIVTVTQYCAH